MKVLIIEDDHNLKLILARLVRRMLGTVELRLAESAHEAIGHLEDSALDGQFSLVLSDYNLLCAQTGAEVLEWIREHMPHLESRFVFLSDDNKASSHGVRRLEKPCDVKTLQATLSEMLNL